MKNLLLIILLSIVAIKVSAYDAPPYCGYYDSIDDPYTRGELRESSSDEQLYNSCLENDTEGGVVVNVADVLDNYYDIRSYELNKNKKILKQKLIATSANAIMKSAYSYQNAFDTRFDTDEREDLNSCLAKISPKLKNKTDQTEKEFSEKITDKKQYRNNFLKHHLLKALYAKRQFVEIEKLKSGVQEETKQRSETAIKKCGYARSCSRKKQTIRRQVKKEYNEKLAEPINRLQQMVGGNPLLFELHNDFKITDWFNSELTESKPMKALLKNIPKDIISKLNSLPADASDSDWMNFYLENSDELEKYSNKIIKDKNVNKAFKDASKNHIDQLQESATNVCESDGENLQHFPLLVDSLLEKTENSDKPEIEIMKIQSAHCALIREDPDKEVDSFTMYSAIGLGSIVLGIGCQAFPIIGNGVGATLIFSGAAVMAGQSTANYLEQSSLNETSFGMHAAGWEQYAEVMKANDKTNDFIADIAMDIGFSFGGIAISKIKEVRHLSSANKRLVNINSFEEIAKKGDDPVAAYKELIWDRHNQMVPTASDISKTAKIDKAKSKLMGMNSNPNVPAYYKYGTPDRDEYGMITQIVSGKSGSDEVVQAFDDLDDVIKSYKSYATRVDDTVDEGFSNIAQYDELRRHKGSIKFEDFADGKTVDLELTRIVNGKAEPFTRKFTSLNDFNEALARTKKAAKDIFSQGSVDDVHRKSEIFRQLDLQAENKRVLELTRDRLRGTSHMADESGKRAEALKKVEEALADASLAPRLDATRRLNMLELKAEVTEIPKFKWVQKILRRNSKYDVTKLANESVNNTGRVGLYIKASATASITAPALYKLTYMLNQTEYGKLSAGNANKLNVATRSLFEGTVDEYKCAESARTFSFKLCFYDLLATYIRPEILKARGEADQELELEDIFSTDKTITKSLAEDPQVREKVREYTTFMLRMRQKMRGGEVVTLADQSLAQQSQEIATEDLLRLVEEVYPDDEEALKLTYAILNEENDTKRNDMILDLSEKYDEKFAQIIGGTTKKTIGAQVIADGRLPLNVESELHKLVIKSNSGYLSDKSLRELEDD